MKLVRGRSCKDKKKKILDSAMALEDSENFPVADTNRPVEWYSGRWKFLS